MKFVMLCDKNYLKSDLKAFLSSFPKDHELEVFSSTQLLDEKILPACDALLVDAKTWQKSFSVFRYFDVADQLEGVPIGLLSYKGMLDHSLKGRSRFREIPVPVRGSTEDILSALDRLLASSSEVTGLNARRVLFS
jgi:hypothetical protein